VRNIRLGIALLSVSFCILAVSFSFMSFYGQVFEPSPLMNTNMKFWTNDPTNNITRPYLWQVDIIKGPHDNVSLHQTEMANRQALEMKLSRSNVNNTQVWTTLHVRQDIHGQALGAIFTSEISLWVFPTMHYRYDDKLHNPENTFGVEINDGTNLLWYVFSDEASQVFQLSHHRIVLMETPLDTWSLRQLDIGKQFQAAGWKQPESISFTLILGTTQIYLGTFQGYFSGLTVNVRQRQTESLTQTQSASIIIGDAIVIMALGLTTLFLQKHKTEARPVAHGRRARWS
jgi:hypothetical protein